MYGLVFLSPMERAVFRAGLAARRPMIWVKPFGLTPGGDSAAIQTAIIENSTRLVVGHLNPDGMLACLLCETLPDLEIQYL